MAREKIDVEGVFRTVIDHCRKLESWQANDKQIDVIRTAFDGIFNKAQTATRTKQLPWQGFCSNGVVNPEKLGQCLQSAFGKLYLYHTGVNNGYLGTIINATSELELVAEFYGLTQHSTPTKRYYEFVEGSEEYVRAKLENDENRQASKAFANNCDTFIQVLIYLKTGGKTSSRAGDIWRKAMGVA